MANDLNIPTIADGQADGQWQTSNDGDAAIGNALADVLLVDFSAGNVTLSSTQYRSAMVFKPSAALAAARTLILPAVKRPFEFHNSDATYTVTLKSTDGASPETTLTKAVAPGEIFIGYTNGSSPGLYGAVVSTTGGGVSDGDKGDVTVSSSGAVWTIDNDVVTNAKSANMAQSTIKGRAASAGTGDPTDLTVAQVVAIIGDTDGTLAANSDSVFATQKATKTYVDGLAVNLGKRARVRAATTANITISTALNNADTLDGVTLATGDLVLVKDQSAPEANGVYVVGVSPARSTEFDTYNEHPGALIVVEEGTANADTLWLCTSNDGGTLNTTAIAFSQIVISGAVTTGRQIISGSGLTGGGDLSADRTLAVGAGTGITVNADDVALNVNGLTEDTSPDESADFLLTYDTSASTHKKVKPDNVRLRESLIIAVGDETTVITTGVAKVTFRMPYAFTLTDVRASLTTVSSSGLPTVDIKESGTTIFSTKLTIDASEKTSTTAATPAVISDAALADDAEITINIDVAGTGATGLKVYLIGVRA